MAKNLFDSAMLNFNLMIVETSPDGAERTREEKFDGTITDFINYWSGLLNTTCPDGWMITDYEIPGHLNYNF